MHSALRHGARAAAGAGRIVSFRVSSTEASSAPVTRALPWTCAECRFQAQFRSQPLAQRVISRHFTNSARRQDESKQHISSERTRATPNEVHESPATASKALPSHIEERRWQLSKDMTKFIDDLLARASIAGQQINAYTGTDYTGIQVLREEILAQEHKVKDSHQAVREAKASYDDANNKQSAAQKEIVSLLERKSSWSPTDLERYMSLVRSEHVHEQAVQLSKESLAMAERNLEDSRALLERWERKQYHEEQIWSDTIRRNSTWVTFGLMGVNIVLLLAQILIFEPYRRRKIVQEVKNALDDKTVSTPSPELVKQVDEAIEPAGTALETIKKAVEPAHEPEQPLDALIPADDELTKTAAGASGAHPEEATDLTKNITLANTGGSKPSANVGRWEPYVEALRDLFSERLIQIKKVELTTLALEGAVAGATVVGLLFLLGRR